MAVHASRHKCGIRYVYIFKNVVSCVYISFVLFLM